MPTFDPTSSRLGGKTIPANPSSTHHINELERALVLMERARAVLTRELPDAVPALDGVCATVAGAVVEAERGS